MHWSEDSLLHSDMALQEAEATGDPFLGLYEEEDPFSYMRITNKDHGEEEKEDWELKTLYCTRHFSFVLFYCY